MFEPHISGILWCDLGLLGAFITLERLGRVALCIVVCSCLMSFSMDQGPGRRPRKQVHVGTVLKPGCLLLQRLPRYEEIKFVSGRPVPVNRREFAMA